KENILGHRELEGVTKSCPGNRFSMVELRKILSSI
ncbi:N-acetylmuramoyl-L-alanine amidase, partial [Bacillus thuringiensis]|nr:N-acetylmuramoyl-L-alanine amidase [Bacillus thuringiensis]